MIIHGDKFMRTAILISSFIFLIHGRIFAQEEYYGEYSDYDSMIVKAENKASGDGKKVLETGRIMTLTNKEILPGSCWDYANAVYDRAGYGWGQREEIFKSVKEGPFVDIKRIKYGDWLYYINHSYGGIEHSAIFVEWIDFGNKLALMLSYGGEQRRQPARYLPYDLSNVYGITRANASRGTTKTATKTTNVTSSNVSNKTESTNANTNSASVVSVSGGTVNGMKVESLKFGTGVVSMEVAGEGVAFSGTGDKVYCWMRVTGGQGKTVKVKWYLNGNAIGETPLDIKSNSMRTYAYRTVTGKKGTWKVEIVDVAGAILHTAGFTVN